MYENTLIELIDEFWKIGILGDLIERDLFGPSELFARPKKMIAMAGLRRVGKTYAIFQLMKPMINRHRNKTKRDSLTS